MKLKITAILILCMISLPTYAQPSATAAPAVAPQPSISIGVIDVMRLVAESTAGKSIMTQLDTRAKAIDNETKTIEQALIKEEDAIVAAKPSLSAEDFEKKRVAFETKLNASRESINKKSAALEQDRAKAFAQLQQYIAKVSATIAEQRKLRIIVDRASIVIVEQNLDVTNEALTQLNASVKSIKVGG